MRGSAGGLRWECVGNKANVLLARARAHSMQGRWDNGGVVTPSRSPLQCVASGGRAEACTAGGSLSKRLAMLTTGACGCVAAYQGFYGVFGDAGNTSIMPVLAPGRSTWAPWRAALFTVLAIT